MPDERLLPHVDSLLDVFDLTEKADSLVSGYSTGQKKKIAMCTPLSLRTRIVTGHFIIPGYDRVLIAPLLMAATAQRCGTGN